MISNYTPVTAGYSCQNCTCATGVCERREAENRKAKAKPLPIPIVESSPFDVAPLPKNRHQRRAEARRTRLKGSRRRAPQ